MQNKKGPYEKVYTSKKLLRNAGTFFLNAAVLSRKILGEAENRIGIQYRQIQNIKGLGSDQGKKKT